MPKPDAQRTIVNPAESIALGPDHESIQSPERAIQAPTMKAKFINVDLDIASRHSLELLGSEFESLGADILFSGKIPQGFLLRLEAGYSSRRGIDRTIGILCELIDRLSPKARLLMDAAQSRDFDVGVDGRTRDRASVRLTQVRPAHRRLGWNVDSHRLSSRKGFSLGHQPNQAQGPKGRRYSSPG
jgi:hypothetical protein